MLIFTIFLSFLSHTIKANENIYFIKVGDSISKILKKKNITPLYGAQGYLIKAIDLNRNIKNLDKIYPGQKIKLPSKENLDYISKKDKINSIKQPFNTNISLKYFKESLISIPENKYEKTNQKLKKMGLKTKFVGVDWNKNKNILMYKILVIKYSNDNPEYKRLQKEQKAEELDIKTYYKKEKKKTEYVEAKKENSKSNNLKKRNSHNFYEYSLGATIGTEILLSTDSNSNNAVLWTINPGLNLKFNFNISKNFKIISDAELFFNDYREPLIPTRTALTQDKKLTYNLALGLAYKAFTKHYIFFKTGMRSFHYIYGNAIRLTVDRLNTFYSSLGTKIQWTETENFILSSNFVSSIIFPKITTEFNTKMGFGFGGSLRYSIKMTEKFNLFTEIFADYNNLNPEITKLSIIKTYVSLGIEGSF